MEDIIINNDYRYVYDTENKKWHKYYKGQLMPDSPSQIYKYYANNIENIASIHDGYFWLANPKSFNDPFDCNINLIIDEKIRNYPFERKRNDWKNIGITSFSEVKNDPLMWAHYTNNYNGFAIKFNNITVLVDPESKERSELCPVIYTSDFFRMNKESPVLLEYVLTVKSDRWSYEKEWRIIKDIKDSDRKLFFEKGIVEEVYIGHRIPDEFNSTYYMLTSIIEEKYPNASMYVVYPDPDELKLGYDKIYPQK